MIGAYEFKRWTPPSEDKWVELPRGHWTGTKPSGVLVCCPECGQIAGLPHAIDAAGNVTPSLVCPNVPKCTMHLSPVRMLEWDIGEKPASR